MEQLNEKPANKYPRVWNPNLGKRGLWQYKHRDKAEEILGRKLKPGEMVHHKDDDETNWRKSNLQVVSRAEHARIGKPALKHTHCKIKGCKNPHHAKGYCHTHYMKFIKKVKENIEILPTLAAILEEWAL